MQPQYVYFNMTNLVETNSLRHSNGGAGVHANAYSRISHYKIGQEGADAQYLRRSTDEGVQLRFARAIGSRGLSFRRSTDEVQTQHDGPDVDFRPRLHPAQFASDVMSITSTGNCHAYRQMSLGLQRRYLPMRFSISHDLAVVRDIILQHSLTVS